MLVPSWAAKDAVLIWQSVPEPHLENLPDGKNVLLHERNAGGTAGGDSGSDVLRESRVRSLTTACVLGSLAVIVSAVR